MTSAASDAASEEYTVAFVLKSRSRDLVVKSDEPMLRLAEKGYLVSGEQVTLAFEGGRRLV